MLLPNKRPEQPNSVSLYDSEAKCPKGMKSFFTFIFFEDNSYIILSNIYAKNRQKAFAKTQKRFSDCMEYVCSISIHEG